MGFWGCVLGRGGVKGGRKGRGDGKHIHAHKAHSACECVRQCDLDTCSFHFVIIATSVLVRFFLSPFSHSLTPCLATHVQRLPKITISIHTTHNDIVGGMVVAAAAAVVMMAGAMAVLTGQDSGSGVTLSV